MTRAIIGRRKTPRLERATKLLSVEDVTGSVKNLTPRFLRYAPRGPGRAGGIERFFEAPEISFEQRPEFLLFFRELLAGNLILLDGRLAGPCERQALAADDARHAFGDRFRRILIAGADRNISAKGAENIIELAIGLPDLVGQFPIDEWSLIDSTLHLVAARSGFGRSIQRAG